MLEVGYFLRRAVGLRPLEDGEVEDDLAVLYAPLRPVPSVLVLGAGLDAVPVVGIAVELGWRVSVALADWQEIAVLEE